MPVHITAHPRLSSSREARRSGLTIAGGKVVDGTGTGARLADVVVENGRVVAIGAGVRRRGRTLEAHGCIVMPGAVDIHTHDDFTLPLRPQAEARVRQGITTTVTGNCGFSPFPLDGSPAACRHGAFFEPELAVRWPDLSTYARDLVEAEPAINVAPMIGLGAVRLTVLGEEDRGAGEREIAEMRRAVALALDQGAFGATTGLVYAPGCYADADELSSVLEPVAAAGGFYATHMRDEANELEASVIEAIETGRRAGCPTHISHHKAIGRRNWGRVVQTLERVDAANREGGDVTLDAYPYVAGSSTLLSLLPAEHQIGGVDAIRARLGAPATRAALVAAIEEERVFALADVVLASVPSRPELDGSRLVEAAARSATAPGELVADLIAADGAEVVMVVFGMSEDDMARILAHPQAMVGSDGWVLAAEAHARPHPRNFSTTARFLTRFVRNERRLELGEAVRKLTALPARRLGLTDRGVLAEGAAADVLVLNMDALCDRATFEEPCLSPDGIEHVIVNGIAVLEEGEMTGARPGSVLRGCGASA